ncbi:peptidyl-prolyl cis-trans isomerase FKBP65-like [Prunus avium]|uniref:peptidylprolyl isomerase n=1 Tax=Prunus avium TaxID=42229 RepID=A0A6P5TEE6_PRUAV|nr:peptidyl-prolyl cis-trans isomerase FKBP65-like [Prunus avium]
MSDNKLLTPVHYIGTLLDGTKFESTRDKDEALTIKLGQGRVVKGLDHGVVSMKKGEIALFTLPAELGYGVVGGGGSVVPSNAIVRFEFNSFHPTAGVKGYTCVLLILKLKDTACVLYFSEHSSETTAGRLSQVSGGIGCGTVVVGTPEEVIEFYVKDGHFCSALPKAIKTMKRVEKVRLIVQPQYAFSMEGRDANNGFHSVPLSSVLNIDLVLVSFKLVIDVTGDAKVIKKVTKEEEGAWVANESASVTGKFIEMHIILAILLGSVGIL